MWITDKYGPQFYKKKLVKLFKRKSQPFKTKKKETKKKNLFKRKLTSTKQSFVKPNLNHTSSSSLTDTDFNNSSNNLAPSCSSWLEGPTIKSKKQKLCKESPILNNNNHKKVINGSPTKLKRKKSSTIPQDDLYKKQDVTLHNNDAFNPTLVLPDDSLARSPKGHEEEKGQSLSSVNSDDNSNSSLMQHESSANTTIFHNDTNGNSLPLRLQNFSGLCSSDSGESDTEFEIPDVADYDMFQYSLNEDNHNKTKNRSSTPEIIEIQNTDDEIDDFSDSNDHVENFKNDTDEVISDNNTTIPNTFNDSKVDNNVYCHHNSDSVVVLLNSRSKIYFYGCANITILNGAAEVLGYTLTESNKSVDIFSPRGASLLYLEHKDQNDTNSIEHVLSILQKLNVPYQSFANVQPNTTIILSKQVNNKSKINFIQRNIAQEILPKYNYGPYCFLQEIRNSWNVLNVDSKWDTLIDSMKQSSRTLICGGKSVGKSVFLRYAINKLLTRFSEIAILDLDPGQPEFTISGCISAHIVKEPIFGPNYTHLQKPYRCFHVPYIDIGHDPVKYLAIVGELVKSSKGLEHMPILINYMGFTRGIGLELLCAVVATTYPTSLIEIKSKSRQKNFSTSLTYELISSNSKMLAPDIDYIPSFDIHTLVSMSDNNQGWHLEPRQIRELCTLSYLSEILPRDVLSLTDGSVPIYVVKLSLTTIIGEGQEVDFAVANANLVALCSQGTNFFECIGWGIVRGINPSGDKLYLMTPVQKNDLQKCSHLVVGPVFLPPSLYMISDDKIGLVPYVTDVKDTTFLQGQIPKRSHVPKAIYLK